MNPKKKLGPLSIEAAEFQLTNHVKSSVDEGAKVLSGSKSAGRESTFMEPVFTGLKPGIAAYHEELFGPVASFYEVKNEQASIGLANDSDFCLGVSVLKQDIERGKKIAGLIDTGIVFVNHLNWTQAGLPFGGKEQSRFGRLVYGNY